MRAIDVHLRHLDDAWGHAFESLSAILEGTSDVEAEWQAPAYAAEERESGWPAPGSIRWHVGHVAHCARYYEKLLAHRGESDRPPADPREAPADFAGEVEALRQAHEGLRAAVARLADTDLDSPLPNGMSVTEFLAMATRHATWHAAQIAVARRLWRTRADA